jgi:hypothetical protein
MIGRGQGCRVDFPKVPSETVQQPLCPTWAVCSCIERSTPLWQKSGSLSLACAVITTCHGVSHECCALKHELNVCDSLCIPALQLGQPFHPSLSWMYDHFLTLCTILWHGILLVCCHLTPLSINDEFQQRTSFTHKTDLHYKLLCRTKLQVSVPLHINLSSEQYLTLVVPLACYLYRCCLLLKSKMLD